MGESIALRAALTTPKLCGSHFREWLPFITVIYGRKVQVSVLSCPSCRPGVSRDGSGTRQIRITANGLQTFEIMVTGKEPGQERVTVVGCGTAWWTPSDEIPCEGQSGRIDAHITITR